MVVRVKTVAFQGIEVLEVNVQVHMSNGLPAFSIVGLPDKAVAESRERVRAALNAMGLALPAKRIIVNLAPADVQKEGSHYDLPVAMGILGAMGVLPAMEMEGYLALGELALDGALTMVAGVLPAALEASRLELGLICPAECGGEAAWAGNINVLAPSSLLALINHFKGTQVLGAPLPKIATAPIKYPDLADVKGQETAKRALEIAAAGNHNLLMVGPPGGGKSMLAARLPSLLPPLTPQEALEVTMIHSVAGQLKEGSLIQQRPFRDPHHSASLPALVGGGHKAQPGEISLAHQGVLFLDELPEFARATLEALRQPLETGKVVIARANSHVTYPSKIQLIAAMNPCRCGYMDDPERSCNRVPRCGEDYQSKISGPLLDRMDLYIEVEAVKAHQLSATTNSEKSSSIAGRVKRARELQIARYHKLKSKNTTNSHASGKLLEEMVQLDRECQMLLNRATEQLKLSARGYHRVLRVSRTIADLEECENVRLPHIAEALSYRKIRIK